MPAIKGKILSFNISPKGFCESFLMNDGKRTIQINFPREAGDNAADGLKTGQKVSLEGDPIDDPRASSHPVFTWSGQQKTDYKGSVKQINFSRHGEPNGAILKNGEFVHLHPEGAKAVNLKIGQKLSGKGEATTSPNGYVVIEAQTVNGIALDAGKPKHKAKKKHSS